MKSMKDGFGLMVTGFQTMKEKATQAASAVPVNTDDVK